MHFYEASIITTKDGLHCQVYGNEHPLKSIIVKPKYIPTEKLESDGLQYRFISGKKMNRLNLWADKEKLKKYLTEFRKAYPSYVLKNTMHKADRLFFSVPIDNIERIYFPRRGLSELMKMPMESLDDYLKIVYEFVEFLLKSGLRAKDLGITYSTLMGHYISGISDINIVVYGKKNFWTLMEYLKNAKHEKLRWKTEDEWKEFRNMRNRAKIFSEQKFVKIMMKKKSEGFFDNNLFVIFGAEKEEEAWFRWDSEEYTSLGLATVQGKVTDNFSSVVRPGCYGIEDSNVEEFPDKKVKKIVFYSRDYCMLAEKGEKIKARGILEHVRTKEGDEYHRLTVGYFDSYITERREKEYIKVI